LVMLPSAICVFLPGRRQETIKSVTEQ